MEKIEKKITKKNYRLKKQLIDNIFTHFEKNWKNKDSIWLKLNKMDFQSAMETFAEAWVAANAGAQVSKFILLFWFFLKYVDVTKHI